MLKVTKDKILIVENNPDSIKLFQMIFGDMYEILFRDTALTAFEILEKNDIKVIICDHINIGESVIDFFEKINSQFPSVQRILITDYIDQEQIAEAINRGRIFNYINKPISPKKLTIIVGKAIDQYNLQENNIRLLHSLKTKNDELKELLQELRSEEEKFRNIFNASPDPILIVDKHGLIISSNPHARSLYPANTQTEDAMFISKLICPEDQLLTKEYISRVVQHGESMIELRIGVNRTEYELNGYPVRYKGTNAIMITLRDLSTRKELQKKLLQTVIQTEEKERRRFAQELHDGIGPLLSTTKLYLQWFNKPKAKMDKKVIISKMEETLEETIASLREVSNNISPNTLMSFGLNTALKTFINRIRNVSHIEFIYENKLSSRLKEEYEITIYRLLCECINNSIKHAEAKLIKIEIVANDFLDIFYSDDGKGFVVSDVINEKRGSGLVNMKTRIQSLGGQYQITSSPDNGTSINIRLINE
ncbi:PAS domain S-box protein [Labilibacter sediminis]|nr:PAS domain S-box protein [Labilibacter sediminis]